MTITKTISLCLALAFTLSVVACAPTPRPDELATADKLMLEKAARARAQKAAPAVFKQSLRFYKLAEEAFDDGEMEDCTRYALLSSIKYSTALENAKRLTAEDRTGKATDRLKVAQKSKAKDDTLRAEAEARTIRMEKILALQEKLAAEKKASRKEKKRIAAEMEKAKKEAQANLEAEKKAAAEREAAEKVRQEQEKKERVVQEAMATARSKLQTAAALDAKNYDPANVNSAETYIAQAEKALADKRYDNALDLAKMASEKIGVATATAQAEYAKKQESMKVLEERKSLFADANSIGAEAKQDKRGVVVTLHDMFGSGKGQVLPERTYLLDKVADLAIKYPDYPIVVEGYTDSRGRITSNLALSQSRAQAVLGYLTQQKKLPFERVKSAGYGDANPVADNSKAAGRAKNRRIEVIFLFR